MKLALLNTSILTATGNFTLKEVTLEEAKQLITNNVDNLDSAIGHQSTAEIMTILLGVEVPVNRQIFCQEIGQKALVFKLNGRPEEGKILTVEEIESIGYKFQLLERYDKWSIRLYNEDGSFEKEIWLSRKPEFEFDAIWEACILKGLPDPTVWHNGKRVVL